MAKPDPITTAQALVAERYPRALQAWLAGSVTSGTLTPTSDLDLPVLLRADDDEPHRESLEFRSWLVELFVHSEASLRQMVARDVRRRRPTLARMVSTGLPLLPGDSGDAARAHCAATLAAGPPPLNATDVAAARSALADLLDDLDGGAPPTVLDGIIVEAWRRAIELLLGRARHWTGSGKWLVRELQTLDAEQGSAHAVQLHQGLRAALNGQPKHLRQAIEAVLQLDGSPDRAGYYFASSSS